MKTVSGKVILTKPITLAKAAKMISRFTATDNEATPAFAAYLRSTCAAFDELVQLHKQFDSPLQEPRVKKERTSDVLTKETPMTVKRIKPELVDVDERVYNGGDSKNVRDKLEVADVHGVLKKSKRKKESDGAVIRSVGNRNESVNVSEKVRKDAVNVDEVKGEMGNEEPKNNSPDVGGVNKKSKKKRRDEDVAIVDKDQTNDAMKMNEIKIETGSTSEEMKKSKKKRDKLGKENHNGGLDTVKEVGGIAEAVDAVKNNVDEQKKHKKKSKVKEVKEVKESNHAGNEKQRDEKNQIKEEKESCSIRISEQRSETNAENKDGVVNEKKHKKKKSHESQKGDNVQNIETEATEKKASCKRKHENVVDGELDGTDDAGRSKKKKTQTRIINLS